MNALVAVSKGMRAVKLRTNKILQFLVPTTRELSCIMAVKRKLLLVYKVRRQCCVVHNNANRKIYSSINQHVFAECNDSTADNLRQTLQEVTVHLLCLSLKAMHIRQNASELYAYLP